MPPNVEFRVHNPRHVIDDDCRSHVTCIPRERIPECDFRWLIILDDNLVMRSRKIH